MSTSKDFEDKSRIHQHAVSNTEIAKDPSDLEGAEFGKDDMTDYGNHGTCVADSSGGDVYGVASSADLDIFKFKNAVKNKIKNAAKKKISEKFTIMSSLPAMHQVMVRVLTDQHDRLAANKWQNVMVLALSKTQSFYLVILSINNSI